MVQGKDLQGGRRLATWDAIWPESRAMIATGDLIISGHR